MLMVSEGRIMWIKYQPNPCGRSVGDCAGCLTNNKEIGTIK